MSATQDDGARRSVLDPLDRVTEVMFGLLMALTFTGTMSVTVGEGGSVNSVLLAALGCNVSWGMIDGVMYLLATATERARSRAAILDIRRAKPQDARALVRSLLPGAAGAGLADTDADIIVGWVRKAELPEHAQLLEAADYRAAITVMCLVILATIPPIIPFLVFSELPVAMRVSNFTAVAMLVGLGIALDRLMHNTRWFMGWIVPVIGVVLVAITVALGG
jgi:hypothetical protein